MTANVEVGVDAQGTDRPIQTADVTGRLFAPSEMVAFHAQLAGRHREHSFQCGTLKEAYRTACGSGFSLTLGHPSTAIDDAGAAIHLRREIDDLPARRRFCERRPSPPHLLAVAAAADGSPLPTLLGSGRPPGW